MPHRTITGSQYMELRSYEDGRPRWLAHGPKRSLVSSGLIREDGQARGFYRITQAGRDALVVFRARYGR